MNKGVSLISLIITIIVIIILASLTIFNSLTTVEEAQAVALEKEFNDVCDFVRNISTRAEAGLIDLDLSGDTVATAAELSKFYVESDESEFTAEEQQNIHSLNEVAGKDPKYKYHYITAKEIENGIPGLEEFSSNLTDVKNDYIINFYYGTIIANISPTKTTISGKVR